jgi:hypothetical protein
MADGSRNNVSLSRIVMRLARNPGTEFADGDDHRGYSLVAPLTPDGHLDGAAYAKSKAACAVRRFAPDEEATGEEPVFRLGQHRFAVGEYVSITDEEGRLLTYKVTDVARA